MNQYFVLKQIGSEIYLHQTETGFEPAISVIGAALFREEEARTLLRLDWVLVRLDQLDEEHQLR